jgi:hypothetical protein
MAGSKMSVKQVTESLPGGDLGFLPALAVASSLE